MDKPTKTTRGRPESEWTFPGIFGQRNPQPEAAAAAAPTENAETQQQEEKKPWTPPPIGSSRAPEGAQEIHRQGMARVLSLDQLSPSPKNSFKPISDEIFEELKASIKANGMITPITVRPKSCIEGYTIDKEFEILSGYNRYRANRELGIKDVRCQVVIADDLAAAKLMADANLQRGDVTELEKAWAYRHIYEAMSRQGNRSDLSELDEDEEENELVPTMGTSSEEANELRATVAQSFKPVIKRKRTTEIIGEMYGISARTVSNKIRLTFLVPELYRLYEKREIGQAAVLDLSYLSANDQAVLLELQQRYGFSWQQDRCKALRKEYCAWLRQLKDGKDVERAFAPQRMMRIMAPPEAAQQPTAAEPKIKAKRYEVNDSLFPVGVKKSERAAYIEKALLYILENGVIL